jgi:hypothetical protein
MVIKEYLLLQVENDHPLQDSPKHFLKSPSSIDSGLSNHGLSAAGGMVAHGFLGCSGRNGEVVEEDPVGGQAPPPLAALPLHGSRGQALPQTHAGRTTPPHTKAATCTKEGAAEATGGGAGVPTKGGLLHQGSRRPD